MKRILVLGLAMTCIASCGGDAAEGEDAVSADTTTTAVHGTDTPVQPATDTVPIPAMVTTDTVRASAGDPDQLPPEHPVQRLPPPSASPRPAPSSDKLPTRPPRPPRSEDSAVGDSSPASPLR